MNLVALVDGVPQQLVLNQFLAEFYKHRREVVLRRTSFLLGKAEEKAHLLLGLKIAVENADKVVEIIKKAPDTESAKKTLIQQYSLSQLQAKAILDMRLARLTGLKEKIVKEHQALVEEIAGLKHTLQTPEKVTEIILEELAEVEDKFARERTQIFFQVTLMTLLWRADSR